jgi:hypothetical protein
MEQIKQTVDALDTKVSDILKFIEKPTFVKGLVYLSLMLYAARIAPVPPKAVLALFENVYFKLFVFSLILWTAQISPSTSILIALAFMVTINYTTTGKIWEMMDNVPGSGSITPTPTAPTQAIAMQAASTVMADQTNKSTVVTNVAQNPNTMVITPTIVQTPQGPTVVNPSVVVSSAVVSTPSGQQVVVTPSVTSITPSSASVTPAQSANAVTTLAQAASSPSASPTQAVANLATTASANVTTPAGANAIQQLAQQAVTPAPGDAAKVDAAKQTAMASIATAPAANPSVTPAQSAAAITTLAQAAASPAASDVTAVNNVATIAMSNVSTPAATTAVQQLAEQAATPAPGDAAKVDAAKQTALAGCYPMRNYDMNKVQPNIDGKWSFEDYQTFTATQ